VVPAWLVSTDEAEGPSAHAHDRLDDADAFPAAFERGALLDMRLDEAGEATGRDLAQGRDRTVAALRAAAKVMPSPRQLLRVGFVQRHLAGPDGAAGEAAEAALLVLEGHDGEPGAAGLERGAGKLQPADDAVRPVEPAAERLGVAVRADQKAGRVAGRQAEKVANRDRRRRRARLPACGRRARRGPRCRAH
jgi:hypothetical protein